MLPRPLDNLGMGDSPGLPRQFLALVEQDQGGNAPDGKAAGQRLFRLGIEFAEPERRFEIACGRFERRGHLTTRAAPACPAIDQQRKIAAVRMGMEIGTGQGHGMAGEQGRTATPAFAACAQTVGWRSIKSRALGAGNNQILRHLICPRPDLTSSRFGGDDKP